MHFAGGELAVLDILARTIGVEIFRPALAVEYSPTITLAEKACWISDAESGLSATWAWAVTAGAIAQTKASAGIDICRIAARTPAMFAMSVKTKTTS